ncbi:alpha-ketoglutarate-dependent dioxygenase AlkB [Rhodococcus erythropolis]|jgi:alkylated DNA repair dioxygenase AlkB|uniref:Alpha-ketoglutarate-dependent dioxygenase AlkB n=1 Tax=Rhodococcus erythropolis TaxID=1833 RepID=A0A5N5E1K2_RHOER|nr:alpha-ketoglutarate-dependent dioxygenase AlkB [Rhodococcus erythropolis]
MTATMQPSLFDNGELGVSLADLDGTVQRRILTAGAWVDHRPAWLTGSEAVFDNLEATVPWRSERRQMYDRVVDVPRLVCFYAENQPLPDALLTEAKDALSSHYFDELGEPFATSGLCFYRDGSDSVAWHGDDTGRSRTEDTMVAILSLGAARPLLLRPRGGGESIRFNLGHGDLLVMGGSCQRTWEHCVPKSARALGPRISVQFRTRGVR